MTSTVVVNLTTGYEYHYDLSPKEALCAVYGQYQQNDMNTWERTPGGDTVFGYVHRYGHLVREGQATLMIGDYSVLKPVPQKGRARR
jgi:hypothetical protein